MTNSDNPAVSYARDVLKKRITACEKIQLACGRFLDELAESQKPSCPYKFDIESAARPIQYMEHFLRPTKGAYDRLHILPWQWFTHANMYGWIYRDSELRRMRETMMLLGRGNGKSTLIAGDASYMASKDGERGADVYLLANSKEQATIVYGETRGQIEASPVLVNHFRCTRDTIYYDQTNSKIRRLASDAKLLDGLNPHFCVFDEIHEFEDFRLINVMRRAMTKRRQPMILYISTMGSVLDGPLMYYYQMADEMLKGLADPLVTDRMFAAIYEMDAGDDIEDYTKWVKANPSIGSLLKLDDLRYEWERAKKTVQERADFINKQLNIFTNAQDAAFIDYDVLMRNNGTIDERALIGCECYGGFDLSATEDHTSAALLFRMDDGRFFVKTHTWVPETKVHLDNERIPYYEYQMMGHITICPGEHIEQDDVFRWFCEMSEKYDIRSIGYDPANAPFFTRRLQSVGLTCNVVRQGPITLNGPMKTAREVFLDGKVIHNNNPLFVWYLNNVRLRKDFYDRQKDNWMPTKANRYRKIDGFMAFLFAFTEYIRKNPIIDDARDVEIKTYKLG